MQADNDAIDLARIATQLNAWGVRYLVIGGQALLLHGIPLNTLDTDLWIDPAAREPVLEWLEQELGLEVPGSSKLARPIVTVFDGGDRLDIFFVRAMTNRDGVTLTLDDLYARRFVHRGAVTEGIPVPSIDDLVALKRMATTVRAKDEEGIRYLLAKKLLAAEDAAKLIDDRAE